MTSDEEGDPQLQRLREVVDSKEAEIRQLTLELQHSRAERVSLSDWLTDLRRLKESWWEPQILQLSEALKRSDQALSQALGRNAALDREIEDLRAKAASKERPRKAQAELQRKKEALAAELDQMRQVRDDWWLPEIARLNQAVAALLETKQTWWDPELARLTRYHDETEAVKREAELLRYKLDGLQMINAEIASEADELRRRPPAGG